MQTSDKKFKSVLKAVGAVVLFIVFAAAISLVLIKPFQDSGPVYPEDDYDMLFLGSSRTACGVNTQIIDEALGCKSVKMAVPGCPIDGRRAILESALKKYPVKEVVIEVSTVVLTETYQMWTPEWTIYDVPLIDGVGNKVRYVTNQLSLRKGQYDNLYGGWLYYGMQSWKKKLSKEPITYWLADDISNRTEPVSQVIPEDQVAERMDSDTIDLDFQEASIGRVKDMIAYCHENGIKVTLLALPVSEQDLWTCAEWDQYYDRLMQLAEDCGCDCYDFSLIRDREQKFPDEEAFHDHEHLSAVGQDTFSSLFAEVYVSEHPEDYFYGSYAEEREHSIYNEK